jgi:hypothetical protein
MSEEYSIGYSEGYQAGWNAAMDATPPAAQRQWIGLTDEEIEDIVEEFDGVGWDVAQAIEAKLREKNT